MDFAVAIATASQALKLVKDVQGIAKAVDEADLKLKIADLTGAVAELKNALIDAKEEARRKDEEFRALEANFLKIKDTVEVKGYQYDKNQEGKPTGHPYCPVCIQKDGMLFHTTHTWKAGQPEVCPSCKAEYSNVDVYP